MRAHARTLAHAHTLTHTHSLSHTHTHSLTHTHTHTPSRTRWLFAHGLPPYHPAPYWYVRERYTLVLERASERERDRERPFVSVRETFRYMRERGRTPILG